jgi:hypothetical protein
MKGLVEQRCRHFVVRLLPGVQRHQAVDLVQSRGYPGDAGNCDGGDETLLTDIRAVVPANVDIATQEVIQMAEDADPHG